MDLPHRIDQYLGKSMVRKISSVNPPWWINPAYIVLFFIMPLFLAAAISAKYNYYNYHIKVNTIGIYTISIGVVSLLALSLGAFIGGSGHILGRQALRYPGADREISPTRVDVALKALGVISILAYTVLFANVFAHIELIGQLIRGSRGAAWLMQHSLQRIPGVTSLIQLAIPFFSLLSAARIIYPGVKLSRGVILIARILLVLTILRAFLLSERIALIEIAIAGLATPVAFKWRASLTRSVFPAIGVFALFVVFSVGEFFRSWQFYKLSGQPLAEFMINRFLGYFSTSISNGAGLMLYGNDTGPFFTLKWLSKFPMMANFEERSTPINMYLSQYSTYEFNNYSGVYAAMYDYGIVGGAIFMIMLGSVAGYLYSRFKSKDIVGLLMYPVWFIGFFDLIRILYWVETRNFPVVVSALVVSIFLSGSHVDIKKHRTPQA